MGVVPRKAAKLEKVGSNWKKRPLVVIAAKLGSAGTKLFAQKHAQELQNWNRVGQIMIPTLQRVTTPLFLAKNSQNRAKSNRIFPEKSRQEGPWFCNIWIARWLNFVLKIFIFFDFSLLYRVKWGQSWGKTEKKCKL